MHNAEDDECSCEMCDPRVTLSSKPFDTSGDENYKPGKGVTVSIHVRNNATEDDVRRALAAYPEAVETTVETFREMRAQHPTRFKIES